MQDNDIRFTPRHICNAMALLAEQRFGDGCLWIDPCQGDGRIPEAMVARGHFVGGHDIFSYKDGQKTRTDIPEDPALAMRPWVATAGVQNMKIGLLINPPFSDDFMERLASWIVWAGPLCIGGILLHRSDVLHRHASDPWRWLVTEMVAIRGRVRYEEPAQGGTLGSPKFSSSFFVLRPRGPSMQVVEADPPKPGKVLTFGFYTGAGR